MLNVPVMRPGALVTVMLMVLGPTLKTRVTEPGSGVEPPNPLTWIVETRVAGVGVMVISVTELATLTP